MTGAELLAHVQEELQIDAEYFDAAGDSTRASQLHQASAAAEVADAALAGGQEQPK